MSSNPDVGSLIDIFHIYLLYELYCLFEKMKINEKEVVPLEDVPFRGQNVFNLESSLNN